MRTRIAALIISALGVTSAFAADVAPCAGSAKVSTTPAAPAAGVRAIKPKGRMPVRGIDHLVAVYGAAVVADADALPRNAVQGTHRTPTLPPS